MNRADIRKSTLTLAKPISFKWLKKLSGQQNIFPFYHTVSNFELPYIKHLYPVFTEKQFRNDLDFLLSNYHPATFREVLQFVNSNKKSDKPFFFLSFDDGFSQCASVIAPILKKKGVEAAFFVNPAFIDNSALSHRQSLSFIIEKMISASKIEIEKISQITSTQKINIESLVLELKKLTIKDEDKTTEIARILHIDFEKLLTEYRPYLSLDELKKLKTDGFTIGSHGFNHAEFQSMTMDEMKQQIEMSFAFLENHLNIETRIFSFPFTDHTIPLSFFNFLKNEAQIAVSFGTAGLKHDSAPNHIQRIPLELEGFNSVQQIVKAEYFYYLAKAFVGKNLINRQ